VTGKLAPIYRAYTEEMGKIILEPIVNQPAIDPEEAWLFEPKNKELLAKIKKSLQQEADVDLGSFKKFLPKKKKK
jgi:hypothetical protein